MKLYKNLKTSERISMSFSLFGFFSLVLFLLLINITYFFIWYTEQKEMSFSQMNVSYKNYLASQGAQKDIDNFTNYLLQQDTIIIPEMGDLVCSEGVSKKIHEEVSEVQGKYFYRSENILYFIYSKYFPGIGQVKLFFDTTEYIKNQLIIIKVGITFIFLVFLFQFFLGRLISRKLLGDLISISEKLQSYSIEDTNIHLMRCSKSVPEDDEIHILVDGLNTSYTTIHKQTNQLKQFLTDVSHEFKTPLMALSSGLDVLEKKSGKNILELQDLEKHVSDTKYYISKMNHLLETLFLLTRAESDMKKGLSKLEQVSVKDFLEIQSKRISQSFPHKDIHIDFLVEEKLSWDINSELFLLIFDNLLSNAIKFSPQKTSILIEADDTKISISDNGDGVPKEKRKKIFEKFYRTDTNKEGFGVGLFLVERITKILNWKIDVSDSQLGGAEFTLIFDT